MKDKDEVKQWWNDNPFTYLNGQGVSLVSSKLQDREFFENVEKRFRLHHPTLQENTRPLYSNFIDFGLLGNKKILDVACGTGVLTIEFSRMGCETFAIDISPRAVSSTKRNLKLRNLSGNILEMDAQKMYFDSSTFDFVNAHGCLMHMPKIDLAIKEIYRVLKNDSYVYAWVYHKGWYFWFGIIFLRGICKGMLIKYKFNINKLTSRYSDGLEIGGNPNTIFQSKSEAVRRFKEAGFKKVSSKVIFNPNEFKSFPSKKISFGQYMPLSIQKYLARFFGLGLIVIAQK